jgi:hypothetical protein
MYSYSDFCTDWCYEEDDPIAKKKYADRLDNIERQKKYRKRHRDDKAHINMLVDRDMKCQFDLLAKYYGVTKIEFLQNILDREEKQLLSKIDEKQKDDYYGVSVLDKT